MCGDLVSGIDEAGIAQYACTRHHLRQSTRSRGTPSTHSRVLRVLACGGGGLALDRAEHVEADHVAAASVLGTHKGTQSTHKRTQSTHQGTQSTHKRTQSTHKRTVFAGATRLNSSVCIRTYTHVRATYGRQGRASPLRLDMLVRHRACVEC
jgi:hypothetical protein